MARKKKHPEHVNHERWLVSYADFITLLFAFFVVMFAASNADQKKAGKVADAVQGAFQELGIFSDSGRVVPLYDENGLPSQSNKVVGDTDSAFDSTNFVAPLGKIGDRAKEMSAVKAQLEQILTEALEQKNVRISEDSRGLTITLNEAGFFDPGSAVIQPAALPVVDRIAATLRATTYDVRVEGHTDNTPIRTAQFPSNWELSTARATHVLQYLIANAAIPPERLSAVGYGEFRPVAENATPSGRAANRRVDIVVLGPAAQKLEPAPKH
jgi:chemotaxis protein MotB